MAELVEFALFAWVAISVVAVVVQMIRRARYMRAARSAAPSAERTVVAADPPTIDLEQRLATSVPAQTEASNNADAPSEAAVASTTAADTMVGGRPVANAAPGSVLAGAASARPTSSVPVAPERPEHTEVAVTDAPVAEVPPSLATTSPAPPEPAPSTQDDVAEATAPATPTLADLLAGVRLPWNLLPTVDHGREPSNHRVALLTDQGEPAQIGVDVADELERLGFTITPQGEDAAIATKEGRSLGLRIIPDPVAAEIDGQRRFPNATDASVALDIWIE